MATSASFSQVDAKKAAGEKKAAARLTLQKKLAGFRHHLPNCWMLFQKSDWTYGDPVVKATKKTRAKLEDFQQSFLESFPGYIPQRYDSTLMLADKMVYTLPLESEIYQFTPPADKISFKAHAYQVCLTPSGEKALTVLFISGNDEFHLSEYPITSEDISYNTRDGKTYMVIHFVSNGVNYRLDHLQF